MSEQILEFEGPFAIWSYTIGHGRLLLRRTKSEHHPRRVDVLFKDVGWMALPSSIDNLTIQVVPISEAGTAFADAGSLRTADRRMFQLRGQNQKGFVLAGIVTWIEDDGAYNDESSLIE